MNKERRNELFRILKKLSGLMHELDIIKDEELECYDNMSEGLQASECGEKSESVIDNLESVIDNLESVIDNLKSVIDNLKYVIDNISDAIDHLDEATER